MIDPHFSKNAKPAHCLS